MAFNASSAEAPTASERMTSNRLSRSAPMISLKRSDLSVKLANTAPVDMPAAAAMSRMVAPS